MHPNNYAFTNNLENFFKYSTFTKVTKSVAKTLSDDPNSPFLWTMAESDRPFRNANAVLYQIS